MLCFGHYKGNTCTNAINYLFRNVWIAYLSLNGWQHVGDDLKQTLKVGVYMNIFKLFSVYLEIALKSNIIARCILRK